MINNTEAINYENTAFIGFGSNLDEPDAQITKAYSFLKNNSNIKRIHISSLYESSPLGNIDQSNYINSVAKVVTCLNHQQLHKLLIKIEKQHKKKVINPWGPRTLDLDLLSYNNMMLQSSRLILPHPGIKYRNFVIIPWYEIEPNFILANNNKIRELYDNCDKNIIKIGSIC